jgi:hypothetical protein
MERIKHKAMHETLPYVRDENETQAREKNEGMLEQRGKRQEELIPSTSGDFEVSLRG